MARNDSAGVTVAAVDLGASSGRVILARVGPDRLELHEAHRFGHAPVKLIEGERSGLHWDISCLYAEVTRGLRAAVKALRPGERLDGIGIDTWGVDYGLLDGAGMLTVPPYCYRDERTDVGVARVHAQVMPEELYARCGVQFQPFNTLYQLASEPAESL
ncbi:MAG: rhamnulokinase, partial [Nocardioides sp.]